MQGRMIYALNYAPAQAEALRNARRGSVVAADGTTVISSFEIQYDADGYVSEIQFTYLNQQFLQDESLWNTKTSWSSMNFGAAIIDQKNTKLGTAGQQFLGPTGDPIPAGRSFRQQELYRGMRGVSRCQTIFEDASGKPVPSPDGVPPIVRWKYDKWGNQIEESYFDASNHPAFWETGGFWKDAFTLDDHGGLMEERFFDVNDKPVAQKDTGCYGYVYERDQNGNGTMKGCLDAQGSPSDYADTGYQKIAFQYDSAGRTVGNLYYGPDGKPVADKRTISAQYARLLRLALGLRSELQSHRFRLP